MKLGPVSLLIGSMALATLGATASARADKVRIAHSTWVGFGPFYIARDKGFFKKRGVEVELTIMESPQERFPAIYAERFDMIASAVDATLLYVKKPGDLQYILALDDSNGGDGIVANKTVASLTDLKGKRIAFSAGSVWQFYLDVLLARAGMKESDLTPVNMSAGDAGAAFIAGKVDAAVTWEPWLTRGKRAEHGHLLADSSTTPGIITDVLVTTKEFIAKRARDASAVADAWNEAVAFQRANPEEAGRIMANGIGGWLTAPKMFAETLAGIKFYGADENKAFFGTKLKPGPLFQTTRDAIEIWSSHKKLQVRVKPEDFISYEFVGG
jgi:NitT/TauT family transport system substrate-binding protein